MTSSDLPTVSDPLQQRIAGLDRGARIFAVTLLLLSSAPNIALLLSIPSSVFLMSLLTQPLPALTRSVLTHPHYFTVIALLWPVAGAIITFRAKQPARALGASAAYLTLAVAQFTFTWAALISAFRTGIPAVLTGFQ